MRSRLKEYVNGGMYKHHLDDRFVPCWEIFCLDPLGPKSVNCKPMLKFYKIVCENAPTSNGVAEEEKNNHCDEMD